jgi:DNA-binding response OmpR family regulator
LTSLLLAEDEAILAQAIAYALEQAGMSLTHARNGEEALRLLRTNAYDMAILDITMPKIDGLEVARLIRQQQDIPILFLTALSGEENILSGFEVGADDYLTKPFSYKELLARIKAVLYRSQKASRRQAQKTSLSLGRISIDSAGHVAKMDGSIDYKNTTLLMMSSGNFGGMDLKKIANDFTQI